MKFLSLFVLLIAFIVYSPSCCAQEYDGLKGFSTFQKYDKTYISPDLRAKHAVSLGGGAGLLSPQAEVDPTFGGHLGYNYIIYKKRKRLFGIKETLRDEVHMGIGAHLTVFANKEWFFSINYLNPLVSLKGKFLSLYFLNEIGIGAHSSPVKNEVEAEVDLNLSLELLRLRFGKSPLNICLTGYFDAGRSMFSKERMDVAAALTLRYYIQSK